MTNLQKIVVAAFLYGLSIQEITFALKEIKVFAGSSYIQEAIREAMRESR